jgi:2'-5' RNA ligase
MPFQWKTEKENILVKKLNDFTRHLYAFELSLFNFNCFEPRVIFIDVVKNEVLKTLQKNLERFCKKELNLFNANYKEQAYHPHITLAFRDLKKQNFIKAWEEFQERRFDKTFPVNSIALLKHDGEKWNVSKDFHLLSQ